MIEIVLWLILSYFMMSLIEYGLHRYPMHNLQWVTRWKVARATFERHAVLHHGRWFKTFDKEDDIAAKHVSLVLNPIENLLGLSPVLFLLYFLVSPVACYTFGAFVAAHALVWTVIHSEMHMPRGRWFAKTRLFQALRAYHKTHHEHPRTNFNIVCLGTDHLFGTYRP